MTTGLANTSSRSIGVLKSKGTSVSFKKASDFMWAIQVTRTRIAKGLLSSEWLYEAHATCKGAAYGTEYE